MKYGTFSSKANSYFRAYNRKYKKQTKEPSLIISSWRYNTSITYILEIFLCISLVLYLHDQYFHKYIPEAFTWRIFMKKVFLKISQNLQEDTCVGVSFLIKLQGSVLQLY